MHKSALDKKSQTTALTPLNRKYFMINTNTLFYFNGFTSNSNATSVQPMTEIEGFKYEASDG